MGLSTNGTVHTNPLKWPEENNLGLMVRKIAPNIKGSSGAHPYQGKGLSARRVKRKKIRDLKKNKNKYENDSGLKQCELVIFPTTLIKHLILPLLEC